MVCTKDPPQRTAAKPGAGVLNESTIEVLMEAYAGGDPRAWGALFDRLAPGLLGFLVRCLRDAVLAETYMQGTFLELHRVRHAYVPPTPVRAWAFSIATRVRVDGYACLDRPEPQPAQTPRTASAPLHRSSRDEQVRQAIDNLPRLERSIIHLHRFERMSLKDIAAVLGSSEAVVQRDTLRAYHRLRQRLSTLGDDGEGS